MAPDERALRSDLASGDFRAGEAAGRWRLIEVVWPHLILAVAAAPRENGPDEFALRLECTGYPHTAPTGGIWDLETGSSLPAERRPKGERAAMLFRADGWEGSTAMYAPWDRVGLRTHSDWAQRYPLSAWNSTRTITFIVANVYEVLNADDYLGV